MWSLLGSYNSAARNSFFGYALSILVAMETFGNGGEKYKYWMCLLIILSGFYIGIRSLKAKSYLGITTSLISLIWFIPLFDENFFYQVDLTFLIMHSAYSLAVAVGAFTFLKS